MGNTEGSVNKDEEITIKIFEMVDKMYPEYSKKITGMLLESDHEELNILFNENPNELRGRIKIAAKTIEKDCSVHINAIDDKELIGTKIYGIAHQLYPSFAANITGMLLEMDFELLNCLLLDDDQLLTCVHKAANAYMNDKIEQEQLSNITKEEKEKTSSIDSDKQEITENYFDEKETLGEQIYTRIEEDHPEVAAKLTGMLLEMDLDDLKNILQDSVLFEETIYKGLEVLNKAVSIREIDLPENEAVS